MPFWHKIHIILMIYSLLLQKFLIKIYKGYYIWYKSETNSKQKVCFAKSVISCQCLAGYSNCPPGSRMTVVVEGHTYSSTISLLHLFLLRLLFPAILCPKVRPDLGLVKGAMKYTS